MDAFGTGIRQADVTGTFEMDISQDGSQITIALYLNPISWVVDSAYSQEYPGTTGAPPVAGEIDFSGTVSSSSFTADETGSQLTSEQLTGTFTTSIITATLSGTAETTDQNGIVVTQTSSATAGPTLNPTTTPTSTNEPLNSRYYGNIASIKGQVWTPTASGNTPLSTGQTVSGTEIATGNNGIVAFETPNQGGTVYLGANSDGGWVGLTSEPAPDNGITYMIYPQISGGTIFPNGAEQLNEMKYTVPLDVALAMLVFSEPLGQAAAIGLFIEGGAFVIPNGVAYVKETVSHLIVVPQGAVAGPKHRVHRERFLQRNHPNPSFGWPSHLHGSRDKQHRDCADESGFDASADSGRRLHRVAATVLRVNIQLCFGGSVVEAGVNQRLLSGGFMNLSVVLVIVAVVLIIVIAAVAASVMRKKKVNMQIHASESSPS